MAKPEARAGEAGSLSDAAFERRPGRIAEDLADQSIVLDLERDRYYAISTSGGRLWALLEQPRTLAELVGVLMASYDVDRDTAESDVAAWVKELLRLELVKRTDTP
jgi:hypothetical protein